MIRVFLFLAMIMPFTRAIGQNCDVDFPAVTITNYSSACGGTSINDLNLGKNVFLGNGDVFTFDTPIINASGNFNILAEGSGKIIIPLGVIVHLDGNIKFEGRNSQCTAANPCTFEVVVNGTLIIDGNLNSKMVNLVWSGIGMVTVGSNFDNTGCMTCATSGCPGFDVIPTKCKDDAGCPAGDFCETISNSCLLDLTKPVITGCPSDLTTSITGPGCTQTVSWTSPTASDNCAMSSFTSSHTPGSSFPKGTTTVTYTAIDVKGNTSTCTFNVIVQDVTKPVISGCPSDITVSANASCQAVVSWTAPTFTDNCSGGTLTTTKTPGSTFSVGTTPVTYTAADAAGNTSTCTFNVIVQDATKPVISGCPSNITVSANVSCQAVASWTAPTFTDNCSGGTLTTTKAPGSTFSVGTTPVTYTATDAAGNTSTCTFNVIVQDVTKPVISGCPSNITVTANASCQAVVSWTAPTFTDNCSGGTLTTTKTPGGTFSIGTTPVTYTATDAAGNTSTCSFNVIVQDATKPVISGCPSNITVTANASCQAVVSWTAPIFTDNCSGGTLTTTKAPGSTFSVGTTPVTYTAKDAAGNASTCSFNVIVQDLIDPLISGCPSDITVTANTSCKAVVSWTAPTFTDNCSGGTLTATKTPGSTFSIGSTLVTYTATDAMGNTSTCSFNVIVQPATMPVLSGCPSDITVNADASCQAVVNWSEPTVTQGCAPATMTSTHTPGGAFQSGTTPVTYTVQDASGNKTTCSFNVNVIAADDVEFINCPQDIIIEIFSGESAPAQWVPPVLGTACSTGDVTSTHVPGQEFEIGKTTVIYSGTNTSGTKLTCSFDVTVVLKSIIVHEVITPNGDGENDVWIIKNIEHFPDNDLIVFDRWGSVIHRAKGYDGSANAWAGANVPAGTYFYTLIINSNASKTEYKGFVELVK
jgi:gliding motility-associated-like protein